MDDFPLVETLMRLNKGKYLYQPVDDPRVKDFQVQRKDYPQRLAFILKHVAGATALDIGCCNGYFSRELTKRGYKVTAIDDHPERLAVTRYLSRINNLVIICETVSWQTYLDQPVHFNNILFLSVFHHDLFLSVDQAFKDLQKFRGKADRVFLEVPVTTRTPGWIKIKSIQTYHFSEDQFKHKLEEAMEMKVTDVWHGKRPIFLLEAGI